MAFPVAHQVFVWLAWRLELRSSLTSRAIGFRGYLVGFFLLFGGRFISLGVPGIYAAYSVQTYFGMIRAAGADHFDARYRQMPLVWEGIFRFTQNGMYVYAFLLFWAIAMGFNE
ncbi:MAG: hypothetical protein MK171_12890 [Pirellulales bacterium]|nr:hypothetical protein [Pirellulales bacterium]